jgi:hypothetical protein
MEALGIVPFVVNLSIVRIFANYTMKIFSIGEEKGKSVLSKNI